MNSTGKAVLALFETQRGKQLCAHTLAAKLGVPIYHVEHEMELLAERGVIIRVYIGIPQAASRRPYTMPLPEENKAVDLNKIEALMRRPEYKPGPEWAAVYARLKRG